jgi:tellurite resistance protein
MPFFIVWGFKVLFKVTGNGVFSCPNCGQDRNYERREARKWFTFFWIPVIPMKVIGTVIRCSYCGNDFREAVLQRPVAGQVADLLQNAVRGVMVNVLRQGGATNPAARAAAVREITLAGATGYQDGNLDQDLAVVPQDLSQMLGSLTAQLPQTGREAMVAGAARVAVADGPMNQNEQLVVNAVGAALGMSPAYVAGVVGTVLPAAPAAPVAPSDPANQPTTVMRVPPQAGAPAQEARPQ